MGKIHYGPSTLSTTTSTYGSSEGDVNNIQGQYAPKSKPRDGPHNNKSFIVFMPLEEDVVHVLYGDSPLGQSTLRDFVGHEARDAEHATGIRPHDDSSRFNQLCHALIGNESSLRKWSQLTTPLDGRMQR
jgi:hypothetical protein